jgi:hypothetical protein
MKYIFLFFAFLSFHTMAKVTNENMTSLGSPSLLLSLMADAKEEEYTFSVKTSIRSDYRIGSYRAYVYFTDQEEMKTLHKDFQSTVSGLVNFEFKSPNLSQAYLVLEVKYGPNFLYDTNATGICVVPFDGVSIFDEIPCNTLVTAEYLLASAMHDSEISNVINAQATQQYLNLQKLPNRKFWQDYLAVHQLLLSHLAEVEDYKRAHGGEYLSVSYQIIQSLLSDVRKYRRIRVQNIDDAVMKIDKTMVNFAYRLYMSIEGLLKRNLHLLPKVEQSPTFIRDFFTGRIVFSLLTEEAAVAANLRQEGDQLTYTYWPWFKYLTIQFDEKAPERTTDTVYKIPPGSQRVDLIGYGEMGRYATLRYTILSFVEDSVTQSEENSLKPNLASFHIPFSPELQSTMTLQPALSEYHYAR